MDLALFFDGLRQQEAKAVCEACPVRAECLSFHHDERYGVFGGLTSDDRGFIKGRRKPIILEEAI